MYFPYHLLAQIDTSPLPGSARNNATPAAIQTAFNIVLAITGAIALLIIVLAGFQYILSQGNPQSVARAKNAIIYGFVGLLVTILSFIIVGFVVGRIT